MNYPIITEERQQTFLEKYVTHSDERYRAYIVLEDNSQASFYGETKDEAVEKAEYYRTHHLGLHSLR